MFSSETEIKMTLFKADLDERFQSAESWAVLCEKAVEEGSANEAFDDYIGRYRLRINAGDSQGLLSDLRSDMSENYIAGAFAAKLLGLPAGIPMIAWSASNRREFPGLRGEIAAIRTLLWAGFDPNAQDSLGATGLHYMVNMKYGTGCNPRAVRDLLEGGASPNIAHDSGDTPLHTLCGHMNWTDEHTECFMALVTAGANFLAQASDGSTPLSLLLDCDEKSPHPGRRKLLAFLNEAMASVEEAVESDSTAEPQPEDAPLSAAAQDPVPAEPEPAKGDSNGIPPELLIAAKEYRAKGGRLGAFGRWAFKEDPGNPEQHADFDRKWAKKKMGTPEGDRIIAEVRARSGK